MPATLTNYALIAEILAATTIMVGTGFAIIQFVEHKKQVAITVAAEMCRKFAEPEMGRAVTMVKRLPNNISLEQMQQMDVEYEASAQIVGMAFETMGLLVHKKVASFELVQELTGGLILMMWRKTGVWIKETRQAESNPRFGEWVEWLVNEIECCEQDMVPAYRAHKYSRK